MGKRGLCVFDLFLVSWFEQGLCFFFLSLGDLFFGYVYDVGCCLSVEFLSRFTIFFEVFGFGVSRGVCSFLYFLVNVSSIGLLVYCLSKSKV